MDYPIVRKSLTMYQTWSTPVHRRRRTTRNAPLIGELNVPIAAAGARGATAAIVAVEAQTATMEETRVDEDATTIGLGGPHHLVELMRTGVTVVISHPSTGAPAPDPGPPIVMAEPVKTSTGAGVPALTDMGTLTATSSTFRGGMAIRFLTSSFSCFRKWSATLSLGSSEHSPIEA